jgi:hypothetical protein
MRPFLTFLSVAAFLAELLLEQQFAPIVELGHGAVPDFEFDLKVFWRAWLLRRLVRLLQLLARL